MEVAGTNIFRIKNTNSFGSSWAVQLGNTGEAQAEVLLLSGDPGAGTLGTTTANSRFEHPADTPIYAIKWNQVVFEVSTTGTAGTAVQHANGTITITPNNWDWETQKSYTLFDDSDGSVSYTYKTYLRNSAIPLTSTESDWIVITPSFYSLSYLRNRVKDKLWNPQFVVDRVVDNWINEWKDEMTNAVVQVNEDYALGTVNVAFGTNGYGTITTTDFKYPRKMEVTYDGSTYVLSTKQPISEFSPNSEFNSSRPQHNWEGDNVFQVKPSSTAGTAKVYFYRTGTPMINDTDELPYPMRSYTKSFVDYGLAQAFQKDGKMPEAEARLAEARFQKDMFVNQLTPRDKTGPTMIELIEQIAGEEDVPY